MLFPILIARIYLFFYASMIQYTKFHLELRTVALYQAHSQPQFFWGGQGKFWAKNKFGAAA